MQLVPDPSPDFIQREERVIQREKRVLEIVIKIKNALSNAKHVISNAETYYPTQKMCNLTSKQVIYKLYNFNFGS